MSNEFDIQIVFEQHSDLFVCRGRYLPHCSSPNFSLRYAGL